VPALTGRALHRAWIGALILLLLSTPLRARAGQEHQGLQGGWAIDDLGNRNFTSSLSLHTPTLHEAEAGWLRLNFRLGKCFENWTRVGCNGRTALQLYDEVVESLLDRGFRVLGLLSNEARHGNQPDWIAGSAEAAGGNGDNPYLRGLAADAGLLAAHFGGRIDHWEVWNEPNAWTSLDEQGRPSGGSFVYPSNFAWLLRRSYEEIKQAHPGALVITGGLFGHDIDPPRPRPLNISCPSLVPSGAEYLCATYEAGLQQAGWTYPYPFDHVGQHLYIDQGGPTSERKVRAYLREVREAYLAYEGANSPKLIFLTEVGWTTATVSPTVQARNIVIAYDTVRRTPYVARTFWFSANDVPEGDLFFGLADASGQKKPAFTVYQDVASFDSPTQ
jgi:hypothetical protein